MSEEEGLTEGWMLGLDDGCVEGSPEELGLPLGCDVGQSETEGFTDCSLLGMLDNEG